MKLFGHPESGHALKVKFCLDAAAIEHEYQVIDIFAETKNRDIEFIQKSKFCEVPLLVDGDLNLIQSNAILYYIAQKFNIYGGESIEKLQCCLEWLVWEANKIGLCLPQIRAHHKLQGFELNQGALDWLLSRYTHDVNILDKQLSDGRSFILGEQITIADFSLCGYLMHANEAKVKVPEYVSKWLIRLKQSNGWANPYQMLS